jgi:flagellar assembly factor FliW
LASAVHVCWPMPEAQTKHFGVVSYDPEAVLRFPAGLPAFEQERDFIAIEPPATAPVVFLQSLARPELCFVTLPILAVDPAYELSMCQEDIEALGLNVERQPRIGAEVACLAILSTPADRPPTANLLAPVVVNLATRAAVQAIRVDSRYSHQQPLPLAAGEASCS